jgi:hypothetical protein
LLFTIQRYPLQQVLQRHLVRIIGTPKRGVILGEDVLAFVVEYVHQYGCLVVLGAGGISRGTPAAFKYRSDGVILVVLIVA